MHTAHPTSILCIYSDVAGTHGYRPQLYVYVKQLAKESREEVQVNLSARQATTMVILNSAALQRDDYFNGRHWM